MSITITVTARAVTPRPFLFKSHRRPQPKKDVWHRVLDFAKVVTKPQFKLTRRSSFPLIFSVKYV